MKIVIRTLILILIAVAIFLVIRFGFMKSYSFKNINYNEYTQLKTNTKINLIYVTSNELNIEEFEQTLLKIFAERKIAVNKLDITKDEEFSALVVDEEFTNYFGNEPVFPTLIVMKDGQIIGNITRAPEETILEQLELLGIE